MSFVRKNFVFKLLFFAVVILICLSLNTAINRNNDINLALAEVYNEANDTGDNLKGFAWSSNFGWISFNCADPVCVVDGDQTETYDIINANYDPDTDTCDVGDPHHTCIVCEDYPYIVCDNTCTNCCVDPAVGIMSSCIDNHPNDPNPDPLVANGYGVRFDPRTGTSSGFAWGPYIGWIAFERLRVCDQERSLPCNVNGDCIVGPDDFGPCIDDDPPSYDFNDTCMSGTVCDDTNNCIACYNASLSVNNIHGWAKVLILGDDGWMNLGTTSEEGIDISGGLPLDSGLPLPLDLGTAGYGMNYVADDQEIHGFTWNGNENGAGMGWLSYNCADYKACSSAFPIYRGEYCTEDADCDAPDGVCVDACDLSDYQVEALLNKAPIITDMSSPNWGSEDICLYNTGDDTISALKAKLKFTYSDDCLASKVTEVCGTSTRVVIAEGDHATIDDAIANSPAYYDTGPCNNSASDGPGCVGFTWGYGECLWNQKECTFTIDKNLWNDFDYNVKYSWFVTVWDDLNLASINKYASTSDTHNDDLDENTFTTYKHEFPVPYFEWFPDEPSQGEQAKFVGTSTDYDGSEPTSPFDCDDLICNWEWDATNADISHRFNSSTTIKFLQEDIQDVTLTISSQDDPANIYCSTSTDFDVKEQLPTWIEEKE